MPPRVSEKGASATEAGIDHKRKPRRRGGEEGAPGLGSPEGPDPWR